MQEIGAEFSVNDGGHFSLRLHHPNPRGVRSVIISAQPNGLFDVTCFGPVRFDAFQAQQLGHATGVVPDSLASVLGMMTGIESLHHHHY